jgi:hypothetical protein
MRQQQDWLKTLGNHKAIEHGIFPGTGIEAGI